MGKMAEPVWMTLQEAFEFLGKRMFPGDWAGVQTAHETASVDVFGDETRRTANHVSYQFEAQANSGEGNERKQDVMREMASLIESREVRTRFRDIRNGTTEQICPAVWTAADFWFNPASGLGKRGDGAELVEVNRVEYLTCVRAALPSAPGQQKPSVNSSDLKKFLDERHADLKREGVRSNTAKDDEEAARQHFGKSVSREWVSEYRKYAVIPKSWTTRGRKPD